MDLTEYEPLFMLVLFGFPILWSYIAYKVSGTGGIGVTAILFFVGLAISLFIINANEYRDASPETIITMMVGALSMTSIYGFYNVKIIIKRSMEAKKARALEAEREKIREQIAQKETRLKKARLFVEKNKQVKNVIALLSMIDSDMELNNAVATEIMKENEQITVLKKDICYLKEKII